MEKNENRKGFFGRAIRSKLNEQKESRERNGEIVRRRQMEARTAAVLREIHELLEVDEPGGEYQKLKIALRNCMVSWMRLQKAKLRFEPADVVLSEVYREGKLLSQVKQMEEFVEDLDDMNDADFIRNMGYAGNLFFLKKTVQEMRRKYEEAMNRKTNWDMDVTHDSVCWFIKRECGKIPALKEVPAAKENASYLLKQMRQERELDKRDQQLYASVVEAGFFLNHWSDMDILELEELEQSYHERREKLEKETQRGLELYRILTEFFTDQWFECLDPKTASEAYMQMHEEEVREVYREVFAKIQEIVENAAV